MQWLTLRKLRSKDYDTRSRAFAEATRNRDVEVLLQVIEDPDEYMRSDAIQALGGIGDPRAVPALVSRLDDANFNNQEHAAAALARIGDRRAATPLTAMLRATEKHPQARTAAAEAVIALADPHVIGSLLDGLRGGDETGRRLILQVIGAIGDARCVPPVVAALDDPSENTRWEAVSTLGALRDQRATEPLLRLFGRTPPDSGLFVEIINALGRLGDPRAGDALSPLLDHPDAEVRTSAAAALDATGYRPTDRGGEARRLVAQCRWVELVALGWETAGSPLMRMLKDGDYKSRRAAVAGLAHFGAENAQEPLIEALMDSDPDISTAAAEALGRIGNAQAIGALADHCARYAPAGGYRNNPQAPYGEQARANEWVKPIETLIQSAAGAISAADLRRLAAMQDKAHNLRVEYDTPGYGDGADDFTVILDLSRVRRLAEDILRHRRLDR